MSSDSPHHNRPTFSSTVVPVCTSLPPSLLCVLFSHRRPLGPVIARPISVLPHSTSIDASPDHRPFQFEVEFEMIIRPRDISGISELTLPDFDATHRQRRSFNLNLLSVVAKLLTDAELHCNVFDQSSDEAPDYSKWHVSMDASVSKDHIVDGFYPVEVVSPILVGDPSWPTTMDRFWKIMHQHFEFRRDMLCGCNIHISTSSNGYNIDQLRPVVKSVVFWEEATARCEPPSRQDQVMTFCKSNVNHETEVSGLLHQADRVQGFLDAFAVIDSLSRDELVRYVCPDKYRSWNFLPSRDGGHGSVEFRRPPGVATTKKAKHWIAFTMAFMEMSINHDLVEFIRTRSTIFAVRAPQRSDFEDLLLASARTAGVYSQLDARLCQYDEPSIFYTSLVKKEDLEWLRRYDEAYGLPTPRT
ncbi:hypothetical protein PMIN06_005209 [Paraphaeosphaeria minitans]